MCTLSTHQVLRCTDPKKTHIPQVSTTKGTGGDVIILEEAAYCDPGFFYETVAPLMLIGRTSLLAISTLTSEINFYSRLIKMKDSLTQVQPLHERCWQQFSCLAFNSPSFLMTRSPYSKHFAWNLHALRARKMGRPRTASTCFTLCPPGKARTSMFDSRRSWKIDLISLPQS